MIEIIPRFALWFIIVSTFVFKDLGLNRLRYDVGNFFSPHVILFIEGSVLKVPESIFEISDYVS